jgi:hypothetical protein
MFRRVVRLSRDAIASSRGRHRLRVVVVVVEVVE